MTEHGLTYIQSIGKADHCEGYGPHRPKAYRFIWHHILPQVCGGQTEKANLVSLCDSCHMTVHALLFHAKGAGVVPSLGSRHQRALALTGYQGAVAAGTVDKIPDEGGHL